MRKVNFWDSGFMGRQRKQAEAVRRADAKKRKTAAKKSAKDLARQQQAEALERAKAAQGACEADALRVAVEADRKEAEDPDDATSTSSGSEFFACLPPEAFEAPEPAVLGTAVKVSQQPELDDEEDFYSYTSESDQSPLDNEAQHDAGVEVDTLQTAVVGDKSQTLSVEASLASTKASEYPEGWCPVKISHVHGVVLTSTERDAETSTKSGFFLVRWFFEAWAWLQSLWPLHKSVAAKQRSGSKVKQPLLKTDAVDMQHAPVVTTSFDLFATAHPVVAKIVRLDSAKKLDGSLFPS